MARSYGYRRRRSFSDWLMGGSTAGFFTKGICLMAAVLFIGYIAYGLVIYHDQSTVATICSKERSATNGGGEYRIYTADKGTFVMKDMHWVFGDWRTNTADVYGKLHVPGTYQIDYVGYRISLISAFPNIVKATRVADDKAALASC